jgi:hypothetical protein
MKDKTIVDWIEQEMLKGNLSMKEILEQAKEMEREQIKKAMLVIKTALEEVSR